MTRNCPRRAYYKPDVTRSANCITFPKVSTFVIEPSAKAQAIKVLEEAAELVEAVKDGDADHARYEAMDVLQALGNLAAQQGWTPKEMDTAYGTVMNNNRERGRY